MGPPRSWCTALLTGALLSASLHSASAQILHELEKEFVRMAEQGSRCCVKVEVHRSIVVENIRFNNGGARVERDNLERERTFSGLLLDRDGLVVTLGDALENASRVSVSLYDGEQLQSFKAELLGRTEDTNLGLLRILGGEPPFDTMILGDSDRIRPGSIAMGLGYTYDLGPAPSCSVGLVNAVDRSLRFHRRKGSLHNLFQISMSIHSGESGGPVINRDLEVIGLLLTSYQPGDAALGGGQRFLFPLSRGVTIAMPINLVKREVEGILAKHEEGSAVILKTQAGPWLGLKAGDITDSDLRATLNLPEGGVWVSTIYRGDPAEKAGIKARDVMVSWNDVAIRNIEHLSELIDRSRVGEQVMVAVIREGKKLEFQVRLGNR